MSCVISAIACVLVAGERERQLREERATSGPSTSWRMPDSSAASARLRATSPPACAGTRRRSGGVSAARFSAIDSGRWIARIATRAIDEVVAVEQRLVDRIGEAARPCTSRAPRPRARAAAR